MTFYGAPGRFVERRRTNLVLHCVDYKPPLTRACQVT